MRPFILLLIAVTAFPQNIRLQQFLFAPYEDPEAYKVYSALLPQSDLPLLIRKDTVSDNACVGSVRAVDKSAASALDNYEKVNAMGWMLQDKFSLPKLPTLATLDEIGAMDAEDQRTGRVERGSSQTRPHFVLSAVGFNADKTIAVVFIFYSGGHGHLAVLRKTIGTWKEGKEGNVCGLDVRLLRDSHAPHHSAAYHRPGVLPGFSFAAAPEAGPGLSKRRSVPSLFSAARGRT